MVCASGDAEAADAILAASCSAGMSGDCERSCQTSNGLSMLAASADVARTQNITLLMNLQFEPGPSWMILASVMNPEELTRFEQLLEAFTPAPTEAAASVEVPDAVREAYPVLVEAIMRSPQVDAKKAKYWVSRLLDMDDEQRANLFESLRNQWWVIPGEDSATPDQHAEEVTIRLLAVP